MRRPSRGAIISLVFFGVLPWALWLFGRTDVNVDCENRSCTFHWENAFGKKTVTATRAELAEAYSDGDLEDGVTLYVGKKTAALDFGVPGNDHKQALVPRLRAFASDERSAPIHEAWDSWEEPPFGMVLFSLAAIAVILGMDGYQRKRAEAASMTDVT